MIFALGIMLMIAAQVARGESTPGLNKYVKEIKRIRDSTLFDHFRRCDELKKSADKQQMSPTPSYVLTPIEERRRLSEHAEATEEGCYENKGETTTNPDQGSPSAVPRFTLGEAKVQFDC